MRIIFILIFLFFTGCGYKCEKASVQKIEYYKCFFAACEHIVEYQKLCEVKRNNDKCQYFVPSLRKYFWEECEEK